MTLILPILLVAVGTVFGRNLEESQKIPLTLELQGDVSDKIFTAPANDFLDGNFYVVMPEHSAKYRIGDVVDNQELVLEDSERNVIRTVASFKSRNRRYIKVIDTKIGGDGVLKREVEEFYRDPSMKTYMPINREPVDFDILNFARNPYIHITYLRNRRDIKFSIKFEMNDHFRIGVCKYGDRIIHALVTDVLYKTVYFYGSYRPHKIIIYSYMKNGTFIKSKYIFVGGEEMFRLEEELTDLETMN
ncbi:signal peptide containing protein [Theileria equi strain WA]|uniref:Signal peptide containing protein n=1 Tax=Theileria equi strain WA TaxID=1537102 RepID=L1LEC4_THEEQ|nr:signal peptide containing protein [Theileria equi strain WA]EKX73605.1 signal peptide containing protein [Theileria equi strain WA]|eukprot:XP_004833057.1 signal peptide containing protein [Theileria equi strain WA]